MNVKFLWHNYKYFPYEKLLGYRELAVLMDNEPFKAIDGLVVDCPIEWKQLAYRTTYFCQAIAEDGSIVIPLQARLESTTNNCLNTNTVCSNGLSLSRQSTRYSAHGLHEYKGKFNPQIVRAIGNIVGLKQGSCVLDPFCGSGTTLLEAAHNDWSALGIDINPLAIEISKAKIASMKISLTELNSQAEKLRIRLNRLFKCLSFDKGFTEKEMKLIVDDGWEKNLNGFDYLNLWFTESVLVQIYAILKEITNLSSKNVQLIMKIILSDIIRDISLQDPADLRIRRRKLYCENLSVIIKYLNTMDYKIKAISNAREQMSYIKSTQEALLGDIKDSIAISNLKLISEKIPKYQFDAAITSPPYANALPYIDTQRLSLVILGLITPDEIRPTEKTLIGNREISSRERANIEICIDDNTDFLPYECISLCNRLKSSIDNKKDGFRKRNVPALIYRYFADMASMFKNVSYFLKPNAPFALVVGRNKTTLGGATYIIDTPYLLTLLAKENGFKVKELTELNTYQRFGIHQLNSVRSEFLIILEGDASAN